MNACIVYKEESAQTVAMKIVAVGCQSAMRAEMTRIAEGMKDDLSSFIEQDGTLVECSRTVAESDGLVYEHYYLIG